MAVKTVNAEEVNFPFAAQIARIDRKRTILTSDKTSQETVYVITSASAQQASPERLLALVRGHWTIENNLHYCRDRTFDEDRCQIRHPNGAQVMATLRNLAISLINLQDRHLPERKRNLPRAQRRFASKLHLAVNLVTQLRA